MKRLFSFFICILICKVNLFSQAFIHGYIQTAKGEPLPGVNIMIKGSFDGATSDANGYFYFNSIQENQQVLAASFIGFVSQEQSIDMASDTVYVKFIFREDSRLLNTVVITAGTFEAGDQRKSVTLRPMDIVTTPSAAGDIYGMLTTLPGTAIVGEDGRLFVRGGDGYETKTFIDGMMVRKPYEASTPDLPSRGRFSPFLFSGTTFSTGGYSAAYGQALSSALLLNTNAFPENTQTEVSLMSVGLGLTQTVKKDNHALSMGLQYSNLEPYLRLMPQSILWNRYPEELGATFSGYRSSRNNSVTKAFATFSNSRSGLKYPDLTATPGTQQDIMLGNTHLYSQVTQINTLSNWVLHSGLSFSFDNQDLDMNRFSVHEKYYSAQGKFKLRRTFSDVFLAEAGTDLSFTDYSFSYQETENIFGFYGSFKEYLPALYIEAESRPMSRLALRSGLRHEYSSVINNHATAWRLSAAWLINRDWQASVAAGTFYQTPEENVLRYTRHVSFEKATHLIANLQYEKQNRILRAEFYDKNYNSLVTYSEDLFFDSENYTNRGHGHARGFDLFFRDRQSIQTLDYWVSYSYLDARRIYRTYPEKVQPPFAPRHSLSVVAKKWVSSLNTMFGAGYSTASGRPYHNPNSEKFMSEFTPTYSDISINASILMRWWGQQVVLYTSVSNVLGRENIFGYRFWEQPDLHGQYTAMPMKGYARRFAFAGLFITIR